MNTDSDLYVCNLEVWNGLDKRVKAVDGVPLGNALGMMDGYRREAAMYLAGHECYAVLYSAVQHDTVLDIVSAVSYFRRTPLSENDVLQLCRMMPCTDFGVLFRGNCMKLCRKILAEEKSKRIVPITLREANEFISAHHRHHGPVAGCRFAIGLAKGNGGLVGAAVCGRPVSRYLDDGMTLEINRLCATGAGNDCSMLYSACVRIAREMGYRKIITYILESEPGTSLRASGFVLEDACCGGANWTGKRKRTVSGPMELKQRWGKTL